MLLVTFPGLTPGAVWDTAYEEYVILTSAAVARQKAIEEANRRRTQSSRAARRGR